MQKYWGISIVEWIALIVISGMLIVYALCQYNSPNLEKYVTSNNSLLNWIHLNKLMEEADNGDLIFMSGNTRGERSCKWFTNSIYSHVGILFREIDDNGQSVLYIFDADIGQKSKRGPRVMKLSDKLEKYHGYPYIMWRKLEGTRPSTAKIMGVCHELKKHEFDDYMISWFVSGNSFELIHNLIKNPKKMFCSECVAYTLKKLNILNNTYTSTSYSPGDFAKNNIKGINPYFKYSEPKFAQNIKKIINMNE